MAVILHGNHMVNVQKRVEVESNIESERAPIHLQVQEERIVTDLDRVKQVENVIIRTALVSFVKLKHNNQR